MRYTFKKLREGDRRKVTKFLFIPKTFDGELRWLEYAEIIEEVKKVDVGGSNEWGNYKNMWVEIGWSANWQR